MGPRRERSRFDPDCSKLTPAGSMSSTTEAYSLLPMKFIMFLWESGQSGSSNTRVSAISHSHSPSVLVTL